MSQEYGSSILGSKFLLSSSSNYNFFYWAYISVTVKGTCAELEPFENDLVKTMANALGTDESNVFMLSMECKGDQTVVDYVMQGDYASIFESNGFLSFYFAEMKSINLQLYNITQSGNAPNMSTSTFFFPLTFAVHYYFVFFP
jgi:hypothetical protein